MSIIDFHIQNYRSIHDVWLKLNRINVIVGPNGTGKSNLYRAMYLMASTASGLLARCVAEEGGVESVAWAGQLFKQEDRKVPDVHLSVKTNSFQYDIQFGTAGKLTQSDLFSKDLELKREQVWILGDKKKTRILDRRKDRVSVHDSHGRQLDYTKQLERNESVLTGLRDAYKFKELSQLREELLDWRFYHQFRTDQDSPLRKPQVAHMCYVLSDYGLDLVSVLATIAVRQLMHENRELDDAVSEAFPGSTLDYLEENGRLKLQMYSSDAFRPFDLAELSDGTLHYLCLLAALMSPRPPAVLALNEPETSLHPRLIEPLAKLIIRASKNSQIWITTHSQALSDHILEMSGYAPLELGKVDGETRLVGVGLGGYRYEEQEDDEDGDDDDDDDVESTD